jgi:hypothetical protein
MNTKRIFLALLIIIVLLSLMIYSDREYEHNDVQIKKYQHLFKNTELYNNTEISFFAEIIKINQTSNTIGIFIQEQPYTYPHVEINIKNININISRLKKGDLIDIVGIIDGKNHITATKLWTNEQWKSDFIYLRSLPAIPFALFLVFKSWKFNWKKLQFTRRDNDS